MPYQPHQKTDKSPEELAQQREVRLRIRMANAYLKEGAVEKALGYMLSVLEMDSVAHKTRTRVAQSILANAGRMGDRGPQVTVDARSQQLTIADLARLAPGIGPMGLEVPNSGSPVSSALRPGDPAPTTDLQDMHRLLELPLRRALQAHARQTPVAKPTRWPLQPHGRHFRGRKRIRTARSAPANDTQPRGRGHAVYDAVAMVQFESQFKHEIATLIDRNLAVATDLDCSTKLARANRRFGSATFLGAHCRLGLRL